jgi:parallel beta-helix repeat protein
MKILKNYKLIASTLLGVLAFINVNATNYYVDPSSTASIVNGSLNYPWKTINDVNNGSGLLNPGDTVFFKRGKVYSGKLNINKSGTAAAPIVYSNYGTGELPEFNNAISDIIYIYNKQYIVIDGIRIIDRSISETDHTVQAKISYAITLDNSPNCTIKNCDISRVGVGIAVQTGSNNTTIINNYMHNMRMVRNTPTTINPDDDYGANPMVIGSSNNTINNNKFEDCWALSYDYGYDGGAVEFFGATMSNNKVMYNTAINCNGFLEIGSNVNGIAENNLIAYNKIINCGIIGVYQNGSTFSVTVKNLQYYNNTIVETLKQFSQPSVLFWMAGTGTPGMVIVKNNIFWLSSGVNVVNSKFSSGQMIHTNNIYRMSSGAVGFALSSSELLSSNVNLFTNNSGDVKTWDVSPLSTSPAINFGTPVGIIQDFKGETIEQNPEAGIIEYKSTVQKITVSPLEASITNGTITCNGGTTTVSVSAIGGTTPYTGVGNFTVKAGNHQFIVSDNAGLKDTVVVTVSEPKAIALSVTSGTISSTAGTTSLIINASGGTSPYLYSLNGSAYQSSNTFSNLVAGTYQISLKDNNGCTGSTSYTINAYQEPIVSVRYKVSIYPNPTTNYFIVRVSHASKDIPLYITVLDAYGKIVYTLTGSIYTSYYIGQQFSPGTYYIKTKLGSTVYTYKVLKL